MVTRSVQKGLLFLSVSLLAGVVLHFYILHYIFQQYVATRVCTVPSMCNCRTVISGTKPPYTFRLWEPLAYGWVHGYLY